MPTRPYPKRRRTINAIVRDRYRSADVLRLSQAALPDIGHREVSMRVRSAGPDEGAWYVMAQLPYLRPAAG